MLTDPRTRLAPPPEPAWPAGRQTSTVSAWPRRARAWLAAASAGLVLGCQAQAPTAPGGDAGASALARLKAEIGEARCSADSQCRTVAVGEKACGGPEAWLAWSSTSAAAGRVQAAADDTTRAARQRNQQGGLMSTCQFMADPGARCEAGRCVLRKPAPLVN